MNKYQRALDELDDGFHNLNNNDVDKIVAVFKELVDKATPKKPTFVESYPSGECPNCSESIGGRSYCHNCGQKIDWSEND